MAKVWLDVGALVAPGGAVDARQLECARLALGGDAAFFAFCRVELGRGIRAVDAAPVHALFAEPPGATSPASLEGPSLRRRVRNLIARLPQPIQAPAMAAARSVLGLMRRGPAPVPAVEPAFRRATSGVPLEAVDVYLGFAPDADTRLREAIEDLRRRSPFRVLMAGEAGAPQESARLMQGALVMASQGGASYEDRLQHLYMSVLHAGDACIDIGAHTGRHTLPMSMAVGEQGRVAAFEPNPAIAQRLRSRLEWLAVRNVAVHEAALSDEAGSAEFVIALDLPEESGLKERTVYNGATRTEKVTVQLATLDSLRMDKPRFIKLDTEGAEYKVLLGARATLARWRPVVAFEFGLASYGAYGVDPDEVFDYFDTLGYDVLSILGDILGKPTFAEASRAQTYWDYVACPRDESARLSAILRSFPAMR